MYLDELENEIGHTFTDEEIKTLKKLVGARERLRQLINTELKNLGLDEDMVDWVHGEIMDQSFYIE